MVNQKSLQYRDGKVKVSRSNPTDNTPNPSLRWFEWQGSQGIVRYYDKNAKNLKNPEKKGENIPCTLPFNFIVLDELSTVKGWHEASESGIYSNEVRDTRAETFVVKSFEGGVLAEGFWRPIADRVGNLGGYFVTNIYIGFKDAAGLLQIGSIQFDGASLSAWMDFKKSHRAELYSKAVKIVSFTQHKKGNVDFRKPVFAIQEISEKTDAEAKALDMLLQNYLKGYFSRTRTEQVAKPAAPDSSVQADAPPDNDEVPTCKVCHDALNAEGRCPNCDPVAQSQQDDGVPF